MNYKSLFILILLMAGTTQPMEPASTPAKELAADLEAAEMGFVVLAFATTVIVLCNVPVDEKETEKDDSCTIL